MPETSKLASLTRLKLEPDEAASTTELQPEAHVASGGAEQWGGRTQKGQRWVVRLRYESVAEVEWSSQEKQQELQKSPDDKRLKMFGLLVCY